MNQRIIFVVAPKNDQEMLAVLLASSYPLQFYRDLPCALRAAHKYAPQALFLAVSELHRRGLPALGRCKRRLPTTKIIVLTDNEADFLGQAALGAGADAVLLKPLVKEALQQAIAAPQFA